MELVHVEKHRAGLVQFLIVVIMGVLAAILVITYLRGHDLTVSVLAIVALLACLYAAMRERRLRSLHDQMVTALVTGERERAQMDERIRVSQEWLAAEQKRADDLGERLDELTSLYRAISAVNAVEDPRSLFDAVVDAGMRLISADIGSIMLVDPTGDHLRIACARGLGDEVVAGTQQPVTAGVAGFVFTSRQPLLLAGAASADPRFASPVTRRRGVKSALSVPLQARGEMLGVLSFAIREGRDETLEQRDLSVASIYSQHASVSIQNARLLLARTERRPAKRDP